MVDRIEQRDRLAVDVDGERHVHVAAERRAHPFRDHGLAVPGRAVQEYRFARVDRRPELLEHVVADDEMREALPHPIALDVPARRRQRPHRLDVGGQRHRHRADVLIGGQVLRGAIAAEVGERVAEAGGPRSGGAPHLDDPFGPRVLDNRLEQGVGQPQPCGQRQPGRLAGVQGLHEQLRDLIACDPRRFKRGGRRRDGRAAFVARGAGPSIAAAGGRSSASAQFSSVAACMAIWSPSDP